MDADCPSKLACFSGECKNPCYETKPCGSHATCSVVDSLPLRTMVCQCEPGYIGDADVACRLGKQPNNKLKAKNIFHINFNLIRRFTGQIFLEPFCNFCT